MAGMQGEVMMMMGSGLHSATLKPESGQLILSVAVALLCEKADTWVGRLYIPHL